jgi:ankyrin repeat protein
MTPLAIGALHHNVAGVKALLGLGAESDLAKADGMGMLPLHAAVIGRSTNIRQWRGSDIARGAIEIIKILTADESIRETINRTDNAGNTPLHLASHFDRLPLVRALLDRGADPSVPTPGVAMYFTRSMPLRPARPFIPE